MKTQSKTLAILITGGVLLMVGGFLARAPAATPASAPAIAAQPAAAPAPSAPAAPALSALFSPPSAFADAAKLPASGSLVIEAALSNPVLLTGKDRSTYYQASISANAAATSQHRSPVQLALVLDRSGSMAGDKLEQTKRAARCVLAQLQEGDRFVLVTYDDWPRVVFPSTPVTRSAVERAQAVIDGIQPGGSTNLDGGVQAGARALLEDHEADHSVRRLVLLSDGQANVGEFRPDALFANSDGLRRQGIGLSAIGVGVDFNAQLMQGMAEHGGGRFRYLEDPAELAKAFSKELELSAKLVAADVRVILHPQDGVRIEEVYGTLFERAGNDVVVRLPDLASTTQFFVRARLSVDAAGGLMPVIDTSATFAEVATDRTRVAAKGNALSASVTQVVSEVDVMANKDVLAEGINARSIEDARRAMELMKAGKKEEALRELDGAMNTVQVANRDLKHAKLSDSWATFGNLRALFAASSNALGGEETYAGRAIQRKAIKNFGSNNMGKE